MFLVPQWAINAIVQRFNLKKATGLFWSCVLMIGAANVFWIIYKVFPTLWEIDSLDAVVLCVAAAMTAFRFVAEALAGKGE